MISSTFSASAVRVEPFSITKSHFSAKNPSVNCTPIRLSASCSESPSRSLTRLRRSSGGAVTATVRSQRTSRPLSKSWGASKSIFLCPASDSRLSSRRNSSVMNRRWNDYRKDFDYAAEINFEETCDAVIAIMDRIIE